ncbi:MAG: adenylyl-sulfate kinase, partial [Candidatus Methanoperedens sp.]|nr:adenylyl-sulfate kinase [Candidatus Methanoperedens sp.]
MAFAVWFTGLPGSGKTVIASSTAAIMKKNDINVKMLQLDEIRRVLTPNPKYTDEERDIVYTSLGYMAKLLTESGVNVFIDATANRRKYRDAARSIIPEFAEIYIRCSLDVCMA